MSALPNFLFGLGNGLCPLCGCVLRGTDEREVGTCILCRPGKYVRMCKACGLADATPDTVLAVKGACSHCGAEDETLYRCPARPAPGVEE